VCADERGEVDVVEAFVSEKRGEGGGGCVDVGQETFWRWCVGVFAADVGLDAGTAGTGDDGVVAGEDWGGCVSELDS
jgi:hypothetical protein